MTKKIVLELTEEQAMFMLDQMNTFCKAIHLYGTGESVNRQVREQMRGSIERSVIEWHDWGSIPDDGEEVLVKYAKGYIDLDTVVYDELEDDVQWWHFDNGDASKAVAWAYLPEGGEDSLAEV